MKLSITRQGLEFELHRDRADRDVARWTRLRMFAWPDNLYRVAARRTIARLIHENRQLRHKGLRQTMRGGVVPYDSIGRRFAEALILALEARDRRRHGEPRDDHGIDVIEDS